MAMQNNAAAASGSAPAIASNLSALDRSQRSVFVGNISYESTEEELRELFSRIGPVVGFRLVVDRDTGKPKGYGFCEYSDQEMASAAIRNMNGRELHGRQLRVDSAVGNDQRSREEIRQLQATIGGPQEESPYGPMVEQGQAPEAISRAVASLPPEQMFELMKQMKLCIQNNPNEARNMLLQNPQLAYALLQAQVVMRIVDPQMAMNMLHRTKAMQPPIMPSNQAGGLPTHLVNMAMPPPNMNINMPPPAMQPTASQSAPVSEEQEKAQLIVQVLQLTDDQINMLPEGQRNSVLILREQLRNSQR